MFKLSKWAKRAILVVVIASMMLLAPAYMVSAATAPDLGTAASFAVLGGTAVTLNTSTIDGDVGYNTAFTNTGSTITGTVHNGDAAAQAAYTDFLNAYDALKLAPVDSALGGSLAGQVLSPGVYSYDIVVKTGGLTLDAMGDANAVWIFQSAAPTGYLSTDAGFSVVMANGGQASNVFWQSNAYAVLTGSSFQGNILADTYITVTSATIIGNALAKTTVTTTSATISVPGMQSWLLDSKTTLPGGNSRCNLDLITTPPGGSPTSTDPFVMTQNSIIWMADEPAGADVVFSSGTWTIKLETTNWAGSCSAEIGDYAADGTFTAFTPTSSTTNYIGGAIIIKQDIAVGMVNTDDYLALKINNSSGASQTINLGGNSYLVFPPSTPDYPMPEMSAGILLALGLAGFGGFMVIRRKKAQKASQV